jgi:hypothetical protein
VTESFRAATAVIVLTRSVARFWQQLKDRGEGLNFGFVCSMYSCRKNELMLPNVLALGGLTAAINARIHAWFA